MRSTEYILTSEEMQKYDKNTVEKFRIPELLLMEQASLAVTEEIIKLFPNKEQKVLVLAGKGNNGGDALAVARLLKQKEDKITVCLVGNEDFGNLKFSNSAQIQYEIIKRMGIAIVNELPEETYDIVVDGIFGVGLSREIQGTEKNVITKINELSGSKIALDLPSGICGTTGKIMGVAVKADYTITFAFLKRGLCFYPGASYAGKIIKKEIGITWESFLGEHPKMYALKGEIREYLPERNPAGHKGTFGKVLLIAGSKEMGGAAILAGKAAMLSGCGMLRICTHKNQKSEIMISLPEAITDSYENVQEARNLVFKGMEWADVIAIGPGLGTDDLARAIMEVVLNCSVKPLVMDADALNLLAIHEFYEILWKRQSEPESSRKVILTPHPLELARILKDDVKNLSVSNLERVNQLAKDLKAVIVKKDARTVICDGGTSFVLNLCGNSGMATAGSGDVLTGIIASMSAVCSLAFEAAAVGVYIHGKAGDKARDKTNEYSVTAGEICLALKEIL